MNKTRKIVVFGQTDSRQCQHQVETLQNAGAEVVCYFPQLNHGFPEWSWHDSGKIIWGEQTISFDEIHSVLCYKRPLLAPGESFFSRTSSAKHKMDWQHWYHESLAQRDRHDTIMGWIYTFESRGKPIYNPQKAMVISENKPLQLQIMREAGCTLPETLITNNPVQAKQFMEHLEHVIAKPAAGGALTINPKQLQEEELVHIRRSPAIFQQRIYGKDLRVMVLDNRVISCVCVCVPEGTLDFRGDKDYEEGSATYQHHTLPDDIQKICIKIAKNMGYRFCGIDIKLTDDNGYYFLEVNSSPIYLDVELKTGDAITQQLASALLS
ncbi:ATP-grasp domain-containing protein [Agarilytica rhodophyticola]|uniref:ATP-grasp domain-containing protein n=1 Tax=Agarilytica rhodophyticola TaxID=1737490 RepID=UPI000B34174B|nr:ATP-grasp domain-containing protein [Agarilytica rhodophyticola]